MDIAELAARLKEKRERGQADVAHPDDTGPAQASASRAPASAKSVPKRASLAKKAGAGRQSVARRSGK